MNVHYIYTINGYLAVSLPYRPLYELCDWVECNKYQVFGQPPPIENGFTRKFTLREGWSEFQNFQQKFVIKLTLFRRHCMSIIYF